MHNGERRAGVPLEQWREALEKRGMKVSRTKYMCLNGMQLESVKMQSAQLPQKRKRADGHAATH